MQCGLISEKGTVPLENVSVKATVECDYFCKVVVEQFYRNKVVNEQDAAISVRYVFPLDDGAAVCGFEAELGNGGIIQGVAKEKEQAKREFTQAVEQGKKAALMTQQHADVFICEIGNLDADETCLVRITYVTELALEGARAKFVLPTVVTPRCVNAPQTSDVSNTAQYTLDASVDIAMSSPIVAVTSPSHGIAFDVDSNDATRAVARLLAEPGADGLEVGGALLKDFVLLLEQQSPYETRALVETNAAGTSKAIQVTFCRPPTQAEEVAALPCEMVFLVDVSGSMAGSGIENTKKALQIFLRSLPTGCRFNMIKFSNSHQSMSPESIPYSQSNLERAAQWVSSLRAGGGTNILGALNFAVNQLPTEGYPRQVFVLTDGQVSNSEQTIRSVKESAHHTRVFAFGVGSGASRSLVNGIARAGKGRAEFIQGNDEIAQKVMRTLTHSLKASLCGVRVDWSAFGVDIGEGEARWVMQWPQACPPMYPGDRYFVYAIKDLNAPAEGAAAAPEDFDITVTGNERNAKYEKVVSVSGEGARMGNTLHCLAARARIRELEDMPETAETKREIISLGCRYNLSSSQTSFVAIKRNEGEESSVAQGTLCEMVIAEEECERTQLMSCGLMAGGGMGGGGGMTHSFKSKSSFGGNFGRGRGSRRNMPNKKMKKKMTARSSAPMACSAAPSSAVTFQKSSASGRSGMFSRIRSVASGFGNLFSSPPPPASDPNPALVTDSCSTRHHAPRQQQQQKVSRRMELCDDDDSDEEEAEECLAICDDTMDLGSAGAAPRMRAMSAKECAAPCAPQPPCKISAPAGAAGPEGFMKVTKAPSLSFETLVSHQHFDGHWEWTSDLESLAPGLRAKVKADPLFQNVDESVLVTCLILYALSVQYAARHEEWSLMANKARAFIQKLLSGAGNKVQLNDLLTVVKTCATSA